MCTNRSKQTSLIDEEVLPLNRLKIDPKRNLANFNTEYDKVLESEDISKSTSSDRLLCSWKLLRKLNKKDQIYSKFSGFIIDLIQAEQKKTVMTYLPPIETPITEYGTLLELFHRSNKMAKQSNMKYTHITLDCGTAIKAYHVLWNNPDCFEHIIIHLGDFHSMQALFGIIGLYVSGSGFEDIIYQLGLCQHGTMKALLKEKHYNQAWMIHEAYAEALSRIFLDKYVPSNLSETINKQNADICKFFDNSDFQNYAKFYTSVIDDGLSESMVKRHNSG